MATKRTTPKKKPKMTKKFKLIDTSQQPPKARRTTARPKTTLLGVRIPTDLLEELKTRAASEMRPVPQYLACLITKAFEVFPADQPIATQGKPHG